MAGGQLKLTFPARGAGSHYSGYAAHPGQSGIASDETPYLASLVSGQPVAHRARGRQGAEVAPEERFAFSLSDFRLLKTALASVSRHLHVALITTRPVKRAKIFHSSDFILGS
ncbi:hypothetical protein FHL15_010605 [Xylaria flabelliformis]|uniref:Uncharacterized protein n=1 Tax=Xylaria flabelliformis TaxID=2512241 RepID=A0A553HKM0_9PEZI|nr:hypothetical protein FHL15_010605 [Xylaria flabelliformis]